MLMQITFIHPAESDTSIAKVDLPKKTFSKKCQLGWTINRFYQVS